MTEMTPLAHKSNYYEILELSTNAAQHEVTTAYERSRKTYSGDNPAIYTIFSQKEARDLLKLIDEAFAVRNVIVHHGSKVDKRLKSKFPNIQQEIGDFVDVSAPVFQSYKKTIIDFAQSVPSIMLRLDKEGAPKKGFD